jgi:hypothetical protein
MKSVIKIFFKYNLDQYQDLYLDFFFIFFDFDFDFDFDLDLDLDLDFLEPK